MKKIFVVSDIHGYYLELINALDKAGFDENNDNHLLISLGDMFDRGDESLSVYKYLKELNDKGKAICLKGNHEPMFVEYLKGFTNPFNFTYNGTNTTLDDFLHRTRAFEMFCLENKYEATLDNFHKFIEEARKEINDEFPELLNWLENLPYYFETENFIFTHASIDTEAKNWRKPKCLYHNKKDWEALTWDNGNFLIKDIKNTDKTVIVGHFDTGHLRKKWQVDSKDKNDHSILYQPRKIFIDGCVALTKKINVLVLQDNFIKEC